MKIADTYLDIFHSWTCQANVGSLRNLNRPPGEMFYNSVVQWRPERATPKCSSPINPQIDESHWCFAASLYFCYLSPSRKLTRWPMLQLPLTHGSGKNSQVLPTFSSPSLFFSPGSRLSSASCTKPKLSNKRFEFTLALTHVLAPA